MALRDSQLAAPDVRPQETMVDLPQSSPPTTFEDLASINREIAALVRAGLPLESGLQQIAADFGDQRGGLAKRLYEATNSGKSLSEALADERSSLPETYLAVVEAGIRSGRLSAALENYAVAAAHTAELRGIAAQGLVYPLLIVSVGWISLIGVAALVLPAFDALGFQDRLWANALRLSPTGAIAAAIIVPTALFIAALLWWRSSNLAGAAERRTSWIRWIPGAGRSARLCGQAALADMLQAMIDAGVPLPDALSLAGDASGQRRLRDVSHRLAESVRTGNELADQRDDLRGLPPLVRMALLAHRAPDAIAASLRRAAEVYRHQARSWALQVATFAPLVMTGLIGGLMVALSIAVLIQPYFATLEELTRGTVNPLR